MKKAITLALLFIVLVGVTGLFLTPKAQAGIGETPGWSGIVPCGRNIGTAAEQAPCTLCHLIIGIQRIVQYGLYLVIALAFVAIFFSGTMYIVSVGDESAMSNAKDFLRSSLIGFAVVAGAWLIVNTTLWVLGKKGDMGIGVNSWSSFTCSTASSALTGTGGGGATTTTPTNPTNPTNPTPSNPTTCGANNVGTCMQGSFYCNAGYSSVSGGSSCGIGYTCCQANAGAGQACGSGGAGRCVLGLGFAGSSFMCPSGQSRVFGGVDCGNAYVCCIATP